MPPTDMVHQQALIMLSHSVLQDCKTSLHGGKPENTSGQTLRVPATKRDRRDRQGGFCGRHSGWTWCGGVSVARSAELSSCPRRESNSHGVAPGGF